MNRHKRWERFCASHARDAHVPPERRGAGYAGSCASLNDARVYVYCIDNRLVVSVASSQEGGCCWPSSSAKRQWLGQKHARAAVETWERMRDDALRLIMRFPLDSFHAIAFCARGASSARVALVAADDLGGSFPDKMTILVTYAAPTCLLPRPRQPVADVQLRCWAPAENTPLSPS